MIKASSSITGPHLYLFLALVVLGLVVLALGLMEYKEFAEREIHVSASSSASDPDVTTGKLESLFAPADDFTARDFELVAAKNLFSPERQAWTPPLTRTSDDEEQPSPPGFKIDKNELRLYGITTVQGHKSALIYYRRLPENSRHRLLAEGETFYEDRSGSSLAITVARIGKDSVTIETGEEKFDVDLFSHSREKKEAPAQEEVSIFVGGRPSSAKDRPENETNRHDISEGPSETDPGTSESQVEVEADDDQQ